MSRIDELIKEKCPNGVEYKRLRELVKIVKGAQLNKEKLLENGAYPVINGGITPSGYWNEYNHNENSITISQGGASAGYVNFINTKFWAGAHCYIVEKCSEGNNYIYIYHFLKSKEKDLQNSQIGAGIPSVSLKLINSLLVPVPPIEVQEEIVRILDKFSELENELENELEARKKQYEFWRQKLFPHTNFLKISDICKKITSGGTPDTSNEEYFKGTIPWLRTQEVNWNVIMRTELKITKEAISNSSANIIPKNCVIVAMYGATVGKVAINGIELSTNQACCNLEIDETIANYKYVFYWLTYQYKYIKSLGRGSQTNINASIVKKLQLPVPTLEEQERIVNILDKFDKLVNNISEGIPAEIEARRKQYEYYRNELLNFKEFSNEEY